MSLAAPLSDLHPANKMGPWKERKAKFRLQRKFQLYYNILDGKDLSSPMTISPILPGTGIPATIHVHILPTFLGSLTILCLSPTEQYFF